MELMKNGFKLIILFDITRRKSVFNTHPRFCLGKWQIVCSKYWKLQKRNCILWIHVDGGCGKGRHLLTEKAIFRSSRSFKPPEISALDFRDCRMGMVHVLRMLSIDFLTPRTIYPASHPVRLAAQGLNILKTSGILL